MHVTLVQNARRANARHLPLPKHSLSLSMNVQSTIVNISSKSNLLEISNIVV